MSEADAAGEPTLWELLAPTGLPDLLETTPSRLLNDLGLGHLAPAAPGAATPHADFGDLTASLAPAGLPDLPALPALDPLALLTPLTDLLRTFGTGTLPGGSGDPTVMLTGIAQTLQSGIGAATGAIEALSGLWAGEGATGAVAKTTLATADAGGLAAQSAAMSTNISGGLAIVGAGLAALQGVIVKTAGLIAAAMPAIATPPGQVAVLGFAADGLAEAMGVVATTRAQLAVPTAKMAVDGAPVPVTPPPITPDTVTGLVRAALPLVSSGLQLAGTLAGSAVPASGTPLPTASAAGLAPTTAAAGPAPLGAAPGTTLPGAAAPGTGPPGTAAPGTTTPGTAATGAGAGPPAAGAPTVRPAGTVAAGAVASEPSLSGRPVSAEPVGGATPSAQQPAPGWNRPAAATGVGAPFAPIAPAMAGAGATRAAVARGPAFETGAAGPAATVPVLGESPPPPITVDVDFSLGDPETAG